MFTPQSSLNSVESAGCLPFYSFSSKMPCCCAVNCSERSEKGSRLFLLPQGAKNTKRRKQWIDNINRKDYLPQRAYVCEKHFTEDQFENNRMDGKRPLRWDAVPTVFSHEKTPKQRKLPVFKSNKEPKDSNDVTLCDSMKEDAVVEFVLVDGYPDTTVENETNPCVLELKPKLDLAQKRVRKLNKETSKPRKRSKLPVFRRSNETKDSKDETVCDSMKEDIVEFVLVDGYPDTTSDKNETNPRVLELKRKLDLAQKRIRKLNKETEKLKEQIATVFNPDQIEFLKRGSMTGHQWQTETIKKSLKLYQSCGTIGYEVLRRQHYPLPSIRTLQIFKKSK